MAKPIFPRWPESNDESEYWETPPDHFLAQQGKSTSRLYPYDYLQHQEAQAGPSRSPLSSPAASPQARPSTGSPPLPLAELAQFFAGGSVDPSSSQRSESTLTTALPDTSTLAGADFDVDVRSGFLPPESPLDRLGDHLPESQWEHLLVEARRVGLKINGGGIAVDDDHRRRCRQWRRHVRNAPVVTPSHKLQTDIRHARRGHVVLTFIAHFYLHSQPQPSKAASSSYSSWLTSRWSKYKATPEQLQDLQDAQDEAEGKYAALLPASISIPLLLLSSQLDIPPILTYADTVLWNWRFKDPSRGLVASNLEIVETFSGTPSEEHFFLTSLLIELRGVAALDLMRVCLDECFLGDALAQRRVAKYLRALSDVVRDIEKILHDVRTDCDPATFYWGIRPWFRGGDASPHEIKGWYYPSSVNQEQLASLAPRLFTGPSAGQSSLIHALDVFLDVDHAGVKERVTRPPLKAVDPQGQVTADATTLPDDATFMQRMQLYMPGQHRRFLTHLQTLAADIDEDESPAAQRYRETREAEAVAAPDEDSVMADGDVSVAGPSLPPTPLRHLAMTTMAANPEHPLPQAYDDAIRALRSLRDEHMKVAALYIVTQARSAPPKEYAELTAEFVGKTLVDKKQEEPRRASGSGEGEGRMEDDEDEGAGAKGTGGTNLVQFLKDCRTNTIETLLRQT